MITDNDAYAVYELLNYAKNLMEISEKYPITMEQIVKIAELCGKIAWQGKLDIYMRILFDGAKDD